MLNKQNTTTLTLKIHKLPYYQIPASALVLQFVMHFYKKND